jgi:hypothetical protein
MIVLPKMHNPNLILKKHQETPTEEHYAKELLYIFLSVYITEDKE